MDTPSIEDLLELIEQQKALIATKEDWARKEMFAAINRALRCHLENAVLYLDRPEPKVDRALTQIRTALDEIESIRTGLDVQSV